MTSVMESIQKMASEFTRQHGRAPTSLALPDDMFARFVGEMATTMIYTGPYIGALPTEYRVYTTGGSIIITRDTRASVIQKQFDNDLKDILGEDDAT